MFFKSKDKHTAGVSSTLSSSNPTPSLPSSSTGSSNPTVENLFSSRTSSNTTSANAPRNFPLHTNNSNRLNSNNVGSSVGSTIPMDAYKSNPWHPMVNQDLSQNKPDRRSLTTANLARLFLPHHAKSGESSTANNDVKPRGYQTTPFKKNETIPKISVSNLGASPLLSQSNSSTNLGSGDLEFYATSPSKSSKKSKRRKHKSKRRNKPKYFSEDGNQVIKELEIVDDLEYASDYEPIAGDLPDELIILIFQYIPVVYLARDVSSVCKRFAVLWVRGVQTVQVTGVLRKLKEDDFVKFVRKFSCLEVLDLCNTGSSEDFQITDKGLLQWAHKYIYSNADYLSIPPAIDPLSGNYDLNFDYESHLDSLDESPSLYTSTMDSQVESSNNGEDDNDNTETIGDYDDEDLYSVTSTASTSCATDASGVVGNVQRGAMNTSPVRYSLSKPLNNFQISSPYSMLFFTHLYQKSFGSIPRKSPNGRDPSYGLQTLNTLNVQGCHFITENGVKYLTYICQNLTHLNLRGCTKVNDAAMGYISQFSLLEYLDVTGCVHVTDAGMKHLSTSPSKSRLKYLDLTFCHQITDEGVKYLSELTKLEDLTLQCCRHITSQGLTHLVNSCTDIKYLNLTGCHLFDLSGVKSEKGLKHLEKLNMMGCKLTNDSCLRVLSEWTCNLKELVLAFSDMISDEGVEFVLKNAKSLYHLNLKRCSNITDKTVEAISKHSSNVLKYLNLTGVRGFTNQGLSHLQKCQHLQELVIQRCLQVTNEGISNLNNCPSLEILDISENTLVTDESIKTFCKKGVLKQLKVEKCKLSKDAVTQLTSQGISVVL